MFINLFIFMTCVFSSSLTDLFAKHKNSGLFKNFQMNNTFEIYFMNTNSFNTNMENCQMGRQNKILSISLIYKSMPTSHFTKWVQPFLKYLWVSVGMSKYQHTHNKETFHSGKFLVHLHSLSSINIYMQMLLD